MIANNNRWAGSRYAPNDFDMDKPVEKKKDTKRKISGVFLLVFDLSVPLEIIKVFYLVVLIKRLSHSKAF